MKISLLQTTDWIELELAHPGLRAHMTSIILKRECEELQQRIKNGIVNATEAKLVESRLRELNQLNKE